MSFVIAGGNDNHFLSEALAEPPTNETKASEVTISVLARYGVQLLMQETSLHEIEQLSSELPTDTHLVRYVDGSGNNHCDAVRSYSKSDIFDAYYDSGARVLEIANGFGSVKPKLFSDKRKDS